MLRIVTPIGISAQVSIPASRLIRWAVPVPNVVAVAPVNIRVPDEIIIVVDVDVVPAPPAPPTPTTAPPCRADRQSNSK
jgi:hypothetical protein